MNKQHFVNIRIGLLFLLALIFAYAGFLGSDAIVSFFIGAVDDDGDGTGHIHGVKHVREEDQDNVLSDDADDEDEDDVNEEEENYPQLLHEYYKKHNPNRLGDVPMILNRYAGREKELFKKLERKYGVPVLDSVNTDDEEEIVETRAPKKKNKKPPPSIEQEEQEEEDNEPQEQEEEEEEEEEDNEEEEEEDANDDGDDDDEISDIRPDHSFDANEETENIGSIQASRGAVRVIVTGFPSTGINLAYEFLKNGLGYKLADQDSTCSFMVQTMLRSSGLPEFNKFDSYEGIADESTSLFYEELMATYPTAKVVVVVRDVDDWFRELQETLKLRGETDPSLLLRRPLYEALLGNSTANEILWKKKYQLFYERLFKVVPRQRRKLLHVYEDDGRQKKNVWYWLAKYLGGNSIIARNWKPPNVVAYKPKNTQYQNLPDKFSTLQLSENLSRFSRSNGHLKILATGLDATGGGALASALKKLGYSVASVWDHQSAASSSCSECRKVSNRLRQVLNGGDVQPNFGYGGIFQGVDAVVGPPVFLFLEEIMQFNPDIKIITTVRTLDAWYKQIKCKFQTTKYKKNNALLNYYNQITYGSSKPLEYVFKSRYNHYMSLFDKIPSDRLLIIDIAKTSHNGEAWKYLCQFLRVNKCTSRMIRGETMFPSIDKYCTS